MRISIKLLAILVLFFCQASGKSPLSRAVVDSLRRVYDVKNLFANDSIVQLCLDGSPMASADLIAANICHQILDK